MAKKLRDAAGRPRVFADTNLFLRFLTRDVPAQATEVRHLFERAARGEITLICNAMVIAEIVWTLTSIYKLARIDIAEKVLAILNTPGLEVESARLLSQAVTDFAERNVDFIDAYNAAWSVVNGLDAICTFDRKHFQRLAGSPAREPGRL
ncbi:MAG: PIN domain-containing protein [Thermoflexales bacterium]